MCHLDPLLLLLSVYDTGPLSYYKLHGAGVGVLNVLLLHSYVTVTLCVWMYNVYCSTQYIIVLISSYCYILMDYIYCACQNIKR